MGLSMGITGGIMLFTIVLALAMIPFSLENVTSTAETISEKTNLENKITKTRVMITDATVTANSGDITFILSNNSTEKIWNYDKFDVIVTYEPQTGTSSIITDVLSYDTSCPAQNGSWCINQIINDQLDPSVLNFGEALEIEADLTNRIQNNPAGVARITVSTDAGIIASLSEVGQ